MAEKEDEQLLRWFDEIDSDDFSVHSEETDAFATDDSIADPDYQHNSDSDDYGKLSEFFRYRTNL